MKLSKSDFHNNDRAGSLVFSALVRALENSGTDITDWMKSVDYENNDEFEVKLTLEGLELDLKGFAEYWKSEVDRMVSIRAAELVREKFMPINDMLHDMEKEVVSKAKSELGVEFCESDY
jgi:hypothetical protein